MKCEYCKNEMIRLMTNDYSDSVYWCDHCGSICIQDGNFINTDWQKPQILLDK